MSDTPSSPRAALIRDSLVFQLKLLADGLRDFILVPVSLVATVVGLVRSDRDPEREFRQILQLGRETERMINLFGATEQEAGTGTSLDTLIDRAEATLREQVRRGDVTRSAGEALEKALLGLHARARSALRPADAQGDEGNRGADQDEGETGDGRR